MPTFIVNNNPGLRNPVELGSEDLHHALHVLRIKIGEHLDVTDNEGHMARVKLSSTSPAKFETVTISTQQKPKPLTVFLSLIEKDKLELTVQKLTELNVHAIQLVVSERSQARELSPSRFNRLQTIALSAQKQCGRAWPITIKEPVAFEKIDFSENTISIFGSIKESYSTLPPIENKNINVFIGPEGGFSSSEINHLVSNQAHAIHFGETILRSETAAIVFATLLLYRF